MITVSKAHIKLRERVAEDMARFERKGGKIKKLDQGKIQGKSYVFSINPNGPKSPEFIAR